MAYIVMACIVMASDGSNGCLMLTHTEVMPIADIVVPYAAAF